MLDRPVYRTTQKYDVIRSVRDKILSWTFAISHYRIKTICNISNAGCPFVREKRRVDDDEPGQISEGSILYGQDDMIVSRGRCCN
jgi:hypothetical protein